MRLATEEEAREFAAKHPEKNFGALRGIYVITGKDNKPIVFAPNAEMATAMKQRMDLITFRQTVSSIKIHMRMCISILEKWWQPQN